MTSKPSYPQLQLLTEFLEEHPQLAVGGNTRALEARDNAKQLWGHLAVRLNALNGSRRSATDWRKYWIDKKAYIKRVSQRIAAAHHTGVGLDTVQAMSKIDRRLLAVLGSSSGQDASNPNTETNPLSPASSIASAEYEDKSQIQTHLWTAAQTPDSPEKDGACGLEERPTLKREQASMDWLQEIEQQRLTLEQERVALQRERNQQKACFQEQLLERKRERNQQEARFHDQVLERMDGVLSRIAYALIQIANTRHD